MRSIAPPPVWRRKKKLGILEFSSSLKIARGTSPEKKKTKQREKSFGNCKEKGGKKKGGPSGLDGIDLPLQKSEDWKRKHTEAAIDYQFSQEGSRTRASAWEWWEVKLEKKRAL